MYPEDRSQKGVTCFIADHIYQFCWANILGSPTVATVGVEVEVTLSYYFVEEIPLYLQILAPKQ